MEKTSWENVCDFHGHVCPGLAIGFRSTQLALEALGVNRSMDEELVAVVENDACGVDAVQFLSGCTFGKGNLIFRDYGKQVYTFIRRATGKAVRVTVKFRAFDNPRFSEMRLKVSQGDAGKDEQAEFNKLKQEHINRILQAGEESYDLRDIKTDIPSAARIYMSKRCENCGESVMETRTVLKNGKELCIPCSQGKL
jgi:formylmethanofuran dehydrogenase subunit E